MCPELKLLGKTIPSYGAMAVLGGLMGLLVAVGIALRHRHRGKYLDDLIYIYIMSGIGGLIGAKILYLFTVMPQFLHDLPFLLKNPQAFLAAYLSGGFVLYGGILGACFTAGRISKAYGARLPDFLPSLLPAAAVLCGIGRIGCYLAGCCYGIEVSVECPIAVVYPAGGIAPAGVPLLPVPLIEAGFDFLLAVFIAWFAGKEQWLPYALPVYMGGYAVIRFILEIYRGDAIRGVYLGLSTSQYISIVVFVITVVLILRKYRKKVSMRMENSF